MFLPHSSVLFVHLSILSHNLFDKQWMEFYEANLCVFLRMCFTVEPAKSDSDVVFCLQLLSKTLTCTFYLSSCESIDHLCINPILQIGLIDK